MVKYSENEFIDRMHRHGEIRIAPATFYARGSLLFAMQDLETKRDFTIPAYNNLLKGQRLVEVEGQRYDISASDPSVVLQVPDYFLYSLCSDMSRRMPTDFNSNSALLIKDPKQFQRKFFDAVSEKISGWDFKNGNVSYYDPLLDFKKYRVLEMTKHIRFRYQNEFRLVARPKKATKLILNRFL